MNAMHHELLHKLKQAPRKETGHFDLNKYLGTPNEVWGVTSPEVKKIVRAWKHGHPDLTYDQLLSVVTSLYQGATFNEKTLAPALLASYPKLKRQLDITLYDQWLEHLTGWAEIDSSCQNLFTGEEVLANWPAWQQLLRHLRSSPTISKRRASLVLLCKPVRTNEDPQLSNLAFENIAHLQAERDILITKAISWLLRSLIKYHDTEVTAYLNSNDAELPTIAVRETRRKLETGKK